MTNKKTLKVYPEVLAAINDLFDEGKEFQLMMASLSTTMYSITS